MGSCLTIVPGDCTTAAGGDSALGCTTCPLGTVISGGACESALDAGIGAARATSAGGAAVRGLWTADAGFDSGSFSSVGDF